MISKALQLWLDDLGQWYRVEPYQSDDGLNEDMLTTTLRCARGSYMKAFFIVSEDLVVFLFGGVERTICVSDPDFGPDWVGRMLDSAKDIPEVFK